MGKSVPQSTAKHAPSNTRLLNRKLDSRETNDSSLFSERRWSRLRTKKTRQTTAVMPRNPENQVPMLDCANAWTELTMPERVNMVPKIDSMKVIKISQTFQTFIMPRFSCIITECKNAVVESHGSREAFSTGSQPQIGRASCRERV